MTPHQRKFDAIIVLRMRNDVMENKNATPSTCLSKPLEDCDLQNIPLRHGTLKELWATSELLLVNDAISVLIGGNYCLKGVDIANTVTLKPYINSTIFKCSCKTYALFDGSCSHILVVAEKKEGTLNPF